MEQYDQYIAMQDWLTAREVMHRLRIKPQTLYAYASRGRIEAKPDEANPRSSLYRASDVARLEQRRARGRRNAVIAEDAIAWGEPVLSSAITTVARGRLWYRGRDAALLSEAARLEDVARLLWDCGDARFPPSRRSVAPGEALTRMFTALAGRAATDPVLGDRAQKLLYFEAASVLDLLADAISGGPGDGPIHERLARTWTTDPAGPDLLRRALVLLADHELNASTFAVRVAASTRASLAACTLAGLSALSGPLHGGMATRVRHLIAEAARSGAGAAVDASLRLEGTVPGFGHPLYPEGDPRAGALLSAFAAPPLYEEVRTTCEAMVGHRPNVDFALSALAEALDLPEDAPFQIFAMARCTGWIAHALEQVRTGRLIRPRARYIGPVPAG